MPFPARPKEEFLVLCDWKLSYTMTLQLPGQWHMPASDMTHHSQLISSAWALDSRHWEFLAHANKYEKGVEDICLLFIVKDK